MTMADKIVVLRSGRVEQAGRPMDLYSRPANLFVATFLGSPEMNLLSATRSATGFDLGEDGDLSDEGGLGERGPRDVTIGVRPHDIMLGPIDRTKLKATVAMVERTGAETVVTCTLASGKNVCAAMPGQVAVNAGDQVGLGFNPLQLHYFDPGSGKALAA
jgi:ABC-type sugar transport system ATPase subunit